MVELEVRVVELFPHDFPPDDEPTAKETISVYLAFGGKDIAWRRCDRKIADRARELGCPFVMRTGFINDGPLRKSGYFVRFYKENPVPDPADVYEIP